MTTPDSTPTTTYRDRRETRAERLEGWAEARAAKADAADERARSMASVIPFGQPILVGHYSEGRDRRYRDRIGRTFDQAYEHSSKAKSMASRAATIRAQADQSIYSDDPDAIERLTAKLTDLEAQRARIKSYNASCRKGARSLDLLDDSQKADLLSIAKVAAWQLGKNGEFPAYALSNLSGSRDRLAELSVTP
jgi:hypothetical protein